MPKNVLKIINKIFHVKIMKYSSKYIYPLVVVSFFVFLQLLSQCQVSVASAQEINSDLPICNKSKNYFTLNSSFSAQNFSSENYPKDYPQYSKCIWVLTAPIGQLIKLMFSAFSIYTPADSWQCPYAYLQVVEIDDKGKEEIIGRFCGSQIPQTIYSSGGKLRVVFKNTLFTQARGFVAQYSAVHPGMACSAQNTVDENSNILVQATTAGLIKAPQFPKSFSGPVDCTWKITLPPKNGVNISFKSFLPRPQTTCGDSAVEVYNGRLGHGHGNRLGLLCEKVNVPVIYSSGRYLSLRWRAKSSKMAANFEVNFKSFQQTISGSCDDKHGNQVDVEGLAGSIFSPGYPQSYPNSKECIWKISVLSGFNVKLKFDSFQLEAGSSCSDFVEVRDGNSKSSPLMEKLCGSSLPKVLISASSDMYVRFKSNFATSGKGFLAMFEATTTQASKEVTTTPGTQPGVCSPSNTNNINNNLKLSGSSGFVSSPRYPSQYPNSISCTWRISVAKDKRILLEFEDFWIDDQNSCQGDYLEVRDGTSQSSALLGDKYCGNKKPGQIHSTGAHMWLQFVSDTSGTSHGFKAKYTAVSKPFNRFIAVGVAIGVIAFLLIIILIIWKIKKKRSKSEEEHDDNQSDVGTLDRATPDNSLLGNNTDTPHAPPNEYDVRYEPRPVAMETINNHEPQLQNNFNLENGEQFTWFKPSKRKSKGFE